MAIAAPLLFLQGGASVLSSFYGLGQANQEADELEFAAQQEEVNATIRENERKERLLSALASQNVALGVSGITSEGTPMNIMQSDIKAADEESQLANTDSRIKTLSYRSQAKQKRMQGKIQAFSSLFSTGADIAKTGGLGG